MLDSDVPTTIAPPPSLGELGWLFLRIGAVAFGGLGAGLALIERDVVEKRRLLTAEDVTEALTYANLLPGSTVIQVVPTWAASSAAGPDRPSPRRRRRGP